MNISQVANLFTNWTLERRPTLASPWNASTPFRLIERTLNLTHDKFTVAWRARCNCYYRLNLTMNHAFAFLRALHSANVTLGGIGSLLFGWGDIDSNSTLVGWVRNVTRIGTSLYWSFSSNMTLPLGTITILDPSLDGSISGAAFSGSTIAVSLTTSSTFDIVMVLSASGGSSGVPAVLSISDTSSLSWNQRKSIGGGTTQALDEWFAKSPTTLSSDSITVTYGGTIQATGSFLLAFGVSNVNYLSPFDSFGVQTISAHAGGSNPSITYTISTFNEFLIGHIFQAASQPWTVGAGYTQIVNNNQNRFTEYEVFQNPASVLVLATPTSNTNVWSILADALVPVTIPTSPLNLLGSRSSCCSASLNWTIPTSNGGRNITYNVYRSLLGGVQAKYATGITVANYLDQNISAGLIYVYQVSAVNPLGESSKSNALVIAPDELNSFLFGGTSWLAVFIFIAIAAALTIAWEWGFPFGFAILEVMAIPYLQAKLGYQGTLMIFAGFLILIIGFMKMRED